MSDRWRGVIAALLNADLRTALAEVVLGERADAARDGSGNASASGLTDARRTRARERLAEVGLIRETPDGPVFDEAALRGILSENPPAKRVGAARYLDGDGRIDRYPTQAADRIELLRWVAERAFEPGVVMSERETNERLAAFTGDVAVLRRHLVDAELLERTRSGSEYALVPSEG